MGNSEVRGENRHGVGEDQAFASVKDSFLAFREMIQAEETSPLFYIFFCHIGRTAFDPSGIVLEADGKSHEG